MFFVLLEPKKRGNINIPCFGKDLPEEVDGSAGKERCLWTEIPNSPFPCKTFHCSLLFEKKESKLLLTNLYWFGPLLTTTVSWSHLTT